MKGFPLQEPRHPAVARVVVEQLASEGADVLDARGVQRNGYGDGEQLVAEDAGEQSVLPAEVRVDALTVDTGCARDLIDGGPIRAVGGEQVSGRPPEPGRDVSHTSLHATA